jgi:hypothetical protein
MDLKFGVAIVGYDRLTGVLGRCADSMMDFGNNAAEAGGKIYEAGESLVEFGEHLNLSMLLISEGVNKLHELSDSIPEPAVGYQQAMAGLHAHTNLTADALNRVGDAAHEFSNTYAGATAEDYLHQFERLYGVLGSVAAAQSATNAALILHSAVGIDASEATDLLTRSYLDFHQNASTTTDMMAATRKEFGLSDEQMSALAGSVGRMAGAADRAHVPFGQLLALAASAQLQLGTRGAMTVAAGIDELAKAAAKGKVDMSHGLFAALASTSDSELSRDLLPIVGNLTAIEQKAEAIRNSGGAAMTMYAIATNTVAAKTELLKQRQDNLADAVATPALATQSKHLDSLSRHIVGLSKTAEAHPLLGGAFTTGIHDVSSVLGWTLSGLQGVGTAAVLGGYGIEAMGKAVKVLDIESWTLRFMYWGEGIAGAASSTYAFGASLLAASWPLLAIGGAIAVVAVGAYEIYKHWDFFKPYWNGLWDWARNEFHEFIMWLPDEMEAGVHFVEAGAEKLAGGIMRYFKHHSPPEVGPLSDLRSNPLSHMIADSLTPDSYTASRAAGMAGAVAGGVGAGGGATINYSATFNFGGAVGPDQRQAFLDLLRQSAYELKRIIDGESITRGRTALA